MYVCVYVFMYVASVRSDGVCGKCIWRDGDTSRCKRPRTLKEVMSSSALVCLFVGLRKNYSTDFHKIR